MKKLAGWGKQLVSFRLSLSFPPDWKLSWCCFNMFIAFNSLVPALLGIVFLWCKVFDILKGGSSTLLAELTFRHTVYLVQDVHVVDIRVAWLVYLACLRPHVLRAYFNFESKQAISVTLFGRRPNNNDSGNSKCAHAPPPPPPPPGHLSSFRSRWWRICQKTSARGWGICQFF